MRETGDLSFRLLPRARTLDEILFAHMTPIRAFALADPNVAYPRDRLLELEAEHIIGRLADNAVSMVGSITDYERLATETAPQIVSELTAMNVGLLLVLPFCPQCHMAAGVLARAIEKRGIPTTSITTLRKSALNVKPPRASFLNFPLGCAAGRPNEPAQQRAILTAALRSATDRDPARWDLTQLPFSWSAEGNHDWHGLVDDLYRIDNQIRGTVASRLKAHAATFPSSDKRLNSASAAPAEQAAGSRRDRSARDVLLDPRRRPDRVHRRRLRCQDRRARRRPGTGPLAARAGQHRTRRGRLPRRRSESPPPSVTSPCIRSPGRASECMSRAHKRRTRERRYGHRPGQPRLGRVAGPQGKAPCP